MPTPLRIPISPRIFARKKSDSSHTSPAKYGSASNPRCAIIASSPLNIRTRSPWRRLSSFMRGGSATTSATARSRSTWRGNTNGWAGKENPTGYTADHTIHWRFEGPFVDAAVNTSDVRPLVAPLHPIGDEWDDYLAYLRHTGSLVEHVYQLDKQHGFDGTGTSEAKQFAAERLAPGDSM